MVRFLTLPADHVGDTAPAGQLLQGLKVLPEGHVASGVQALEVGGHF